MSGRPSRTDDNPDDDNDDNRSTNQTKQANFLTTAAVNSPQQTNEAQPQYSGNSLVPEDKADNARNRRTSAVSGGENRRLSRLSYSGQERVHHHHHHVRALPQSQYSFKPFTRETMEEIKKKIIEEKARKLQQAQQQAEVSFSPRRLS